MEFPDDVSATSRIEGIVKPLNNTTRLKLLYILGTEGPITYSDILALLGIESGSFYWHIKKMEDLVVQTPDRRYILSTKGEKAFDLMYQENYTKIQPKEEYPSWFVPVKRHMADFAGYQAPIYIIVLFAIYIIGGNLYAWASLMQVGSNVIEGGDHFYSLLSYIISTMVTAAIYLIVIVSLHDQLGEGRAITYLMLQRFFLVTTIITSASVLPSILVLYLFEKLEQLGFAQPVFLLLIVINSSISLLLTFVLTTAAIDEYFHYGFKNSLIISLVVYYPIVIISFAFV